MITVNVSNDGDCINKATVLKHLSDTRPRTAYREYIRNGFYAARLC